MIVYIAGPMTGLPEHNRPAFYAAAAKLNAIPYVTALNPAVLPGSLPDKAYMPICTAMLEAADAIYMLTGWEKSVGARCERLYAKRQRKIILDEEYVYSREMIQRRLFDGNGHKGRGGVVPPGEAGQEEGHDRPDCEG